MLVLLCPVDADHLPHVPQELMSRVTAREHDIIQVIQNSTSPIFSVSNTGRVTEWNYAMERMTGLVKHDMLGKVAVGELFGSKGILQTVTSKTATEATAIEEKISAMLVTALGENGESPRSSESGLSGVTFSFYKGADSTTDRSSTMKQIDASINCRPQFGASDEIIGAFFFIQDLSVPNALEKAIAVQSAAESAAEAKTRHIAFLCHEIRNPVNGILATVQAMEEMMSQRDAGLDAGEMFDLVKTSMSCTDQLRRTVDGILDINELEEEKLDVICSPFQVSTMLRTVVSQVLKASDEKGLYLECEVSPELGDVTLNGDEGRIQQILANFCWNSVKFSNTGGIKILVESEPGEQPGFLRVFFKVVDTGKGMDQKTQESLFQRYAMGQHRVGKYGGSGLGLSICRRLAELMKGHVHCVSTLGKGSTFVLELDLEIVEQTKEESSSSSFQNTSNAMRKKLSNARKAKGRPAVKVTPPATPAAPDGKKQPDAPVSQATKSPATGSTSAQAQAAAPAAAAPAAAQPPNQAQQQHGQQPSVAAPAPPFPGFQQYGQQPVAAPMQPFPSGFQQYGQQLMAAPMPPFSGYPFAASPMAYMPAASPAGQMMHPQSSVSQQLDAVAGGPGRWIMRSVSENVYDGSVGVLIEIVMTGGARYQQWGGAPITGGNAGAALAAAREDALRRFIGQSYGQGQQAMMGSGANYTTQ